MKSKLDNLVIGLVFGFFAPVLTFFLLYFGKFGHLTFNEYIDQLTNLQVFTKVMSLCMLPNLLVFFLFIWNNMLIGARGVLTTTVVFALIMLLLKFVF